MTMRRILMITLVFALVVPLFAAESATTVGSDQALSTLRSGNARYMKAQPQIWSANTDKRELLSKGQHPVACVITCSDSRVSPEILFDQTIGDLFVVRLAGNVVTSEVVGSVEYAVAHLKVPLVVVLGHSSCGAVGAALTEPEIEGPIGTLVSRIKPAIDIAKQKGFTGDDLAGAVVNENARHGAEVLLQSSRVIDDAVKTGGVSVLSATYDLKSGRVAWQTQMCAAAPEPPSTTAVAATPAPDKTDKAEKTVAKVEEKPATPPAEQPATPSVTLKKKVTTKESPIHAGRH